MIRDEKGNLYGTTPYGGGAGGQGVVFQLSPTGEETVLHTFTGDPDGAGPSAGLVRDKEGNLYGTTEFGGSGGVGTVFKVAPCGTETVLYSFAFADGTNPDAGVILDEEGSLYGTTPLGGGGTGQYCGMGCGVVFKLDRAGNETVLYLFPGSADGSYPQGGPLVRDKSGILYGTAPFGGDLTSPSCYYGAAGCGVVFTVDPAGKETVLYSFTGGTDGSNPDAGVIRDKEGNLYGTTPYGGDLTSSSCYYGTTYFPQGCGVVFKITTHEECKRDAQGNAEPDADVDDN